MNNHYVYILKCSDDTLYTGYTVDLQNRLKMHNLGKASKYTRSRLPVKYVFYSKCSDKSEALKKEIFIKSLTRIQKLALINGDIDLDKIYKSRQKKSSN